MRFLCRENHDEEPDRCPPHDFHGASWDDNEGGHATLYCSMCGEVRPMQVPQIGAPEIEVLTIEADAQ